MKLSSKGNVIPSAPSAKVNRDIPLIARLPFSDLAVAPPASIAITPIACQTCGAVLLDTSAVSKDPKLGLCFPCPYCGTVNKIGDLPPGYGSETDVEFILEAGKEPAENATVKAKLEGDLVCAIIDISGSMGGGKLEAVKHNLVQSIKGIAHGSATSAFILVTFESNVELYLSPNEKALRIDKDELLHSVDKLKAFVIKHVEKHAVSTIDKNAGEWVAQVERLTTRDMTALGPGLVTGIASFLAKQNGGRILLLTDGLANVGFGRLEGDGVRESRKLYEDLAKTCMQKAIVVDVIGVGGGNELALDVLGNLSELSGGELFFVSQQELDATFGSLSSRSFVGKDVKVRVFTPAEIEVASISGISSAAKEAKRNEEIPVGSVTADREAYITFDVKKKLEATREVPVQVQVEYKDPASGARKMRVFKTSLKPGTEDDYVENYDPSLLSVLKIQEAGEAYSKGDTAAAKSILTQAKDNVMQFSQASSAERLESMSFLDDELVNIASYEEEKQTKAAKSFSAATGQKRSRVSYDMKKREMQK